MKDRNTLEVTTARDATGEKIIKMIYLYPKLEGEKACILKMIIQ